MPRWIGDRGSLRRTAWGMFLGMLVYLVVGVQVHRVVETLLGGMVVVGLVATPHLRAVYQRRKSLDREEAQSACKAIDT